MASTQPGSAAHAPSDPDAPAPVAPDAKAPTAADGSAANGAAGGPAKGTAGPAKGTAGLAKGTAAGLSELIVGSERGLEAWSLDGARRRTISAAPARHPRWLDPQTVLAIAPREDRALAAGATLQRITLADGRREDIVELPPLSCKPAAASSEEDSFPYEVDLQDDTDFVVAPARGIACMQLLDRNINMASVMLDVRVDLRRRRVERWLVAGDDLCPPPPGVRQGDAPSSCSGSDEPRAPGEPPAPSAAPALGESTPSRRPSAPSQQRSYPFDMPRANGVVVHTSAQDERPALQLGRDYSPEARSPSGRWLVVGGDTVEGDYLYRRLSLLDRESGQIFPILETPGAWPAAIEPVPGSPPTLPPIESAVLAPGEIDPRWLATAEGELLVVGSTIVRPGVGSFSVEGDLAR